ncbi:tripartite tricarboxylate transporter TctB family protein [Thermodesulfobacteriota bacterium]
MKKADMISALFLLVMGVLFIFVIIPQQTGEGEEFGMSPAALPTTAMLIIVGLSLILLFQSISSKSDSSDGPPPLEGRNWLNIGIYTALLFLSLGAIKVIGFIPGGILSIAAFAVLMGARNPISIGLVAVIPPVLLFFALRYGLRVPLP